MLLEAVDRLLRKEELAGAMRRNGEAIRADPGPAKAADLLEGLAVTGG
jgi:UDP:flavonoid glycosyltransferase YjiC (YdhE family)